MSKVISVPLMKVCQGSAAFYVGMMTASDLLSIFTVEPAKYDIQRNIALRDTFGNDEEYFNYRIERISTRKLNQNELEDGFQREASGERVRQIAKYLSNQHNFAMFPNAIIATCDLMNDYVDTKVAFESKINTSSSSGAYLEYIEKNDSFHTHTLHISKKENSLIVIDGQHRILGVKKSDISLDNFYFLISFILEEDRSIIAKHFYTINYTQKGVNKSLLYQLMGEFSTDLEEISYLHELIMALNESEVSPFYKRIKMLGRTDSSLPDDERKKQTLSQAFMIDYMMYTITYDGKRKTNRTPKLLPIFYWYYKNDRHNSILKFIIRYFTAFKQLQPAMGDTSSPLGKTLGIGAMLQLMSDFYITLFFEGRLETNPALLDNYRAKDFEERLSGVDSLTMDTFLSGGAAGVGRLRQVFFDACPWLASAQKPNIKERRESYIAWLESQYLKR